MGGVPKVDMGAAYHPRHQGDVILNATIPLKQRWPIIININIYISLLLLNNSWGTFSGLETPIQVGVIYLNNFPPVWQVHNGGELLVWHLRLIIWTNFGVLDPLVGWVK